MRALLAGSMVMVPETTIMALKLAKAPLSSIEDPAPSGIDPGGSALDVGLHPVTTFMANSIANFETLRSTYRNS